MFSLVKQTFHSLRTSPFLSPPPPPPLLLLKDLDLVLMDISCIKKFHKPVSGFTSHGYPRIIPSYKNVNRGKKKVLQEKLGEILCFSQIRIKNNRKKQMEGWKLYIVVVC